MDAHKLKSKQMPQNENDGYPNESGPSSSNLKRQHEHDDSQPKSKLQRPATPDPMKITDFDDYCLEKICEPLDLHDLFNLAVANEWLRPAVGIVYKRKFGTKKVCIRKGHGNSEIVYQAYHDYICVFGLKLSLQYLRCLGSSVNNLSIWYEQLNSKHCEYIHQYVSKYCTESLIEVEFHHKPKEILFNCFEKPFPNVRTVKIRLGDLESQFPLFTKWFPNVHTLDWNMVRMDKCYIEAPFNHLQVVCIDIDIHDKLQITDEQITYLLRMCCQLQSLKVDSDRTITFDRLLNFIKFNPMIYDLAVSKRYELTKVSVQPSDVKRLISEHPSLVKLNLIQYEFTANDTIELIQTLTSLKEFHFWVNNQLEYDRLVAQLDTKWQHSLWKRHTAIVKC